MIENENIKFMKNPHFDKRKNLDGKIKFAFLIQNHGVHLDFKPERRPWITSGGN
jgi:hypothetical protein